MVHRVLKYADSIAANAVDTVLGETSPRSGQTFDVVEIWFDGSESVTYSLSVRERKLINDLSASNAPTSGERLVYDLRVQEGDELQILASETAGAAAAPEAYILVDES
jgi:hypothetical protein